MDTNNLDGKNAFISGATGAIGKSIALALAERGCNLFLTGSNDERLRTTNNYLRWSRELMLVGVGRKPTNN